jgi:amino acid transporter
LDQGCGAAQRQRTVLARSIEGDRHGRQPPPVPEPSGSPADAVPAADPPERSIGLISATGLVIGSIIGIGVFTMPAVLASAGTSSLIVLAVVAVGAMLLAVLSRAVADDLFPRPFAWTDRRGNAWFGIVIAALLPSLLMLWRYTTATGLTVFIDVVDLTVVTVALPYLFSACAQLTYLFSRRRKVQGWLLARDLTIAGASVLFSMWVTFASGYSAIYQAMVLVLAGLVLYTYLKARRERLGEVPEPGGAGPRLVTR